MNIGRNKKHIFFIIIAGVLLIFLIVIIAIFSQGLATNSKQSENVLVGEEESGVYIPEDGATLISVTPQATWVGLPGGDSEISVINNSTLIVKGVVTSASTQMKGGVTSSDGGMLFTNNAVQIKEVYAANFDEIEDIHDSLTGQKIIVQQTGGVINGKEVDVIGDAPLLRQGTEYVLFLSYSPDDDYYLPVGGRLGVAEVVNGKIEFVGTEAAELFKTIKDKKLSSLTKSIESVENDLDNNIVVNTDKESVLEFLED